MWFYGSCRILLHLCGGRSWPRDGVAMTAPLLIAFVILAIDYLRVCRKLADTELTLNGVMTFGPERWGKMIARKDLPY